MEHPDLSASVAISDNPADWPSELLPLFQQAITCEFATLTRQGQPITQPLNPYVAEDGRSLDVSTGITYPAKAERARHQTHISMLFSDLVGSRLTNPPVVLVLGDASIRSADLQANTDRFVRSSFAKTPEANKNASPALVKRLGWYFVRLWVQLTPLEMYWWPQGNFEIAPQHWQASAGTAAPPSDPPPTGTSPKAWAKPPHDWHAAARHAVKKLGQPIITVVNDAGYPVPVRARAITLTKDGFDVHIPVGLPFGVQGKACLTFHTHPEQFTSQENISLVGVVTEHNGDQAHIRIERRLADWSLKGGGLRAAWSFLAPGRTLAPRLAQEVARYGQTVPTVHLPEKRS